MEFNIEIKKKSELKEEDIFSNKYCIFNKKLLKIIGFWPYQSTWVKRAMRIFIIVSICSIMVPQVIKAYQEWYVEIVNLAIIIECVSSIIVYAAILARLAMLVVQESKMRYIYEEITRDWEEINDSGERAVLQRFCNIGRKLSIFYFVYCHLTVFILTWTSALGPMIINKILNTTYKKSLCIYVEYFVDEDKNFYYIFSHVYICAVVATFLFTTFDSTFVLIVQHTIGLLKVLKYQLNQLYKIFDWSKCSRKDDMIIHNNVKSCIKIHVKALEFIQFIDSTYDTYHCFLYSLVLSGLSIFTIDIILNKDDFFILLRLVPCLAAVIVYIFYFNWPGQKIIEINDEIFTTIYLTNWYSFPLRTQKLMKFMFLRSADHIFIKASIFEMSFKTCSIIMKTALSYITVFISLL
ncbi:uncharacterized protein LOC107981895 [Nasonia vitripennis]|uniref:Odorant receptor n=1 Tax=Nasonia vitripennis TaxID=7425 RepID=A0A7M7PUR4_NASVI|nr:uncharacterized protein LOC107981895 [Nasonia vitripennis]